jgi:DNA-binding NarL/FixJ family response regulator
VNPVIISSTPPDRTADEAAEHVAIPATRKQPMVLIVEDDFLIAVELENRLLDAGYQVVGIASTASEAVSLADETKPDLAVMDIRLIGHRDGVDAAIDLFNQFNIRSIFASAHADAETRKRALPANPIGWVQKPYPADALIRLIDGFLAQ